MVSISVKRERVLQTVGDLFIKITLNEYFWKSFVYSMRKLLFWHNEFRPPRHLLGHPFNRQRKRNLAIKDHIISTALNIVSYRLFEVLIKLCDH